MRKVLVKPAPRNTYQAVFEGIPKDYGDCLLFGSGFTPCQALAVFFENVDAAVLDAGFQVDGMFSVEIHEGGA